MSAATCRTELSFCQAFACSGSMSTLVTMGALERPSRDFGGGDGLGPVDVTGSVKEALRPGGAPPTTIEGPPTRAARSP